MLGVCGCIGDGGGGLCFEDRGGAEVDGGMGDGGEVVEWDVSVRVILILMEFGISISTWFQVVPFCSQI